MLAKIPTYKKVTAIEYNKLIDEMNRLGKITGSVGMSVNSSALGVHLINTVASGRVNITIFEVQSAATGDGIYNCYAQSLDKDEWEGVDGDDKFADLNTASVEVFNLQENDPQGTFVPALSLYDRIAAWKWTDDEGNVRWVGVALFGEVKMVRTTEAAPADTKITCNVVLNNNVEAGNGELGYNIEVNAKISGSGNLNTAVPRLANDDYGFAKNFQGVWWFVTIFQISEDCVCS